MNIHEYQAKALLHEFGVPISQGRAGAAGRPIPTSPPKRCPVRSGW